MDFLTGLYGIQSISFPVVAVVAAIFTRISGLIFFLPGIGERTIPVRVRLGAALAIAMMLTPVILPTVTRPETVSAAFYIIAAEAVSGVLLGFSIRIAVFAIQTGGAMASQGLSLAQLFGSGISDQAEPPIATLLMISAITLAVVTGLHFKAVAVLITTYEFMPLGIFPGASETGAWAAERVGFAFAVALSLALPFVILGFIYNLAIGAANRAMPQLMVAFVGAPAITLAGLILLALTVPVLLDAWLGIMDTIIDTLMGQTP